MMKILIIEDDAGKAEVIESVIVQAGVTKEFIVTTDNVRDAISIMKQTKFDIVVLDMNLPIRKGGREKQDSGITILREIESEGVYVPRNIIGVTGYSELAERYDRAFKMADFNLYSSSDSDDWEVALKSKINWINQSKKTEEREFKRKVIVTVHGIATAGVWQNNLEKFFALDSDKVVLKNFKAPNLSALRLLFPWLRKKIERSFSTELDDLILKYPDSEFYFFSHSFGTHVLASKLSSMSSLKAPTIKAVILAGSVLKPNFPWGKIKKELSIEAIVNDCGTKDKPLIMSELFSPGLGMAGKVGFYSFESETVINRFFVAGHSFFEQSDDFYEKYWLPIINSGVVTKAPTITESTLNSLAKCIVDSIQIYFSVLVIFVGLFFYFF